MSREYIVENTDGSFLLIFFYTFRMFYTLVPFYQQNFKKIFFEVIY